MTDNDFHARRTELANAFATAGAELLAHMPMAAGALAAIPNTAQYVVVGDPAAIRAQLDTVDPQRRMRHGERPELDLYFGPEAGQARRWAALITNAGHGLLQEYGIAFEHALPGQEVLEVMEILPGAPAIANKATEEGELPMLDTVEFFDLLTGYEMASGDIQARVLRRKAIIGYFKSKLSECRQVANKAEVEPVACSHVWNDFGQLGGRNVSWCPRCDVLAWAGKEPEATPPVTTGASTAPDRHPWFCAHCQAGVPNVHVTYEEFHDPRAGGCGHRVGDWPEKVGASTVLTDERTAFEEWAKPDFPRLEGADTKRVGWYYFDAETNLAWDGWKARAEVAAQAGQVAVTETESNLDLSGITSVVLQDRGSKSVIVRFGQSMAAATKFLDQFGTLVLNDRAAPSPAKESK